MFLDEDKVKVSITINPERRTKWNRIVERLGYDEDFGMTEIFDKVFEYVEKKLTPKDSLSTDLEKIKTLESQILSVKQEYSELLSNANKEYHDLSSKTNLLVDENTELTNEIDRLKYQIEATENETNNIISESNQKVKLSENQIIVDLTDVQKEYLEKSISQKHIIDFVAKQNQSGKLNRIIPILDGNAKEKISKLLTAWFFYSTKIGFPPLENFNTWYKNEFTNKTKK